tara:strand:- start:4671 stop:6278 length:1608 start_codon:yes stop_codon:yes gene_type:complete
MSERLNTEVLIVGTGISGLLAAIELSKKYSVTILSKSKLYECSTAWAQGGIAAVVNKNDHVNNHVKDTIKNGHSICNHESVEKIIKQGKNSINLLESYGVNFNKKGQEFDQTLEGGHSQRRIIYHNDNTGEEIHGSLLKRVLEISNINIKENLMAFDMIGKKNSYCEGLYAFDKTKRAVITIKANVIILATGGASKVYQYTTNPNTSTGDGIAMAWRFGCEISNMEFIQFHPTCLYHPTEKSFLISESLRGEGAKLKDPNGNCFMEKYDTRLELAPRDVVARAIDSEMKNNNFDHVHLDISFKDKNFILKRFPNIYQRCLKLGIDISKQPIPVVPAAHYTCGGIETNVSGETDCINLYAIGEVANSGFHGANRLASNSLLECSVMAMECCKKINEKNFRIKNDRELPLWDDSYVSLPREDNILISHNWAELRKIMWNYVGILRSDKMLAYADERLNVIHSEINEFYHTHHINMDLLELRNIIDVANVIISSAMERKESRGLHFNKDYPVKDKKYNRPTKLINSNKDFYMRLVSKA